MCGPHPRGIPLDSLACAQGLRSLHLHMPGGMTLRRLPDGALPELVGLHLTSKEFCSVASLHAAAMPRLRDLQLESQNFVQLPDLVSFSSLERLCIVAPGAAQGGIRRDVSFTVGSKVQLVAVTTEPALLCGAMLASARAVVHVLRSSEKTDAAWEWLPRALRRGQLPQGADWLVLADSSLRGDSSRHALDVELPAVWLSRQEVLQNADLRCLWPRVVTLP